jgi:hypothetical protein
MVHGAYAVITVRGSDPCTGSPSHLEFTTAYVMLYSTQYNGWSQAGYIKTDAQGTTGGQTEQWTQSVANWGLDPLQNWYGPHVFGGDVHTYESRYWSDCGCIRNKIGGSIVSTTSWNPVNEWPSGSWGMEYSGESVFVGGNVPGTSASPASMASMQYLDSTDVWRALTYSITVGMNDDPTHYGTSITDASDRAIYTSKAY